MLLIKTSTSDRVLDLSTSMTLNDLEPPKNGFLVNFFAIFGCSAHFKSELQQNA